MDFAAVLTTFFCSNCDPKESLFFLKADFSCSLPALACLGEGLAFFVWPINVLKIKGWSQVRFSTALLLHRLAAVNHGVGIGEG